MTTETIYKITSKMAEFLSVTQLEILSKVCFEILAKEPDVKTIKKHKQNLIKQFISAKKVEGCSKRTEEYYYSVLFCFEKNITCDICNADTNTIRDYLIKYQKINNCTNVTLDTIRRILSSFYRWLEEEDFIIKSPMKRIHRIKTPSVIKPAFSDEQIENIRSTAATNKRNIAIIDILLSSGIRVSELVNLDCSAVDLNSRTCIVFGKGSKQRETYFDVRTKIELANYLKTRTDNNKALFITERKNKELETYTRLSVNAIEKMIREVGQKTQIDNVHPHRFRRTMATKAIDKGMPIEQVQVLLGHTKIDT
nr:tyrosine-type recombinase/integrase [Treponema sp.]